MSRETESDKEGLRLCVDSLRPIQPSDLACILRWFQHQNVRDHFAGVPQNEHELAKNYDDDNHGYVGINGLLQPVGVLTFRDNVASKRRNGYLERVAVDPENQSKGVGTQMMQKAIEYAFDPSGLNYYRISLGVVQGVEGWERTKHVYEKMGFKGTGVWKDHVVIGAQEIDPRFAPAVVQAGTIVRPLPNGNFEVMTVRDVIWMELLKSDWENAQAAKNIRQ